jgi:hypothetical protein
VSYYELNVNFGMIVPKEDQHGASCNPGPNVLIDVTLEPSAFLRGCAEEFELRLPVSEKETTPAFTPTLKDGEMPLDGLPW